MPRLAVVCRRIEGLSGATGMILEQARRLSRRGWEVHAFGEKLDRAALAAAGAAAHRVPGWPWGSWLKRRIFAAFADRAASRGGFDLVHGHGDGLEQDVLSLHNCVHAAHEAVRGEPLPASDGTGRMHARILSEGRFRRLIANSRQTRDEVARRFGVPEERISVVYPGFDAERFSPRGAARLRAPARSALGFSEEEFVVGLVTSGDFVKRGLAVFLEALGRLCRKVPEARGLVVGKEARLEPYRAQARAAGLADKVRFAEPRPEVERYYHALDVYAHPARYEEFGMSVQEALACGLPVAAGARVGAVELLAGEMKGLVLEDGTAEELAAKLELLAKDPALRRRLAAAGPGAVARNGWDDNLAATLACYERAMAEKRSKS